MSDTVPVPVTVDTTQLPVHPGLLRQLTIVLNQQTETWENADRDRSVGTCAHCGGDGSAASAAPPDPSEFDGYLGLDGVVYHGVGEPDIEATAEAAAEDGTDDEERSR
ncbi:hypothetical protein [Streptomyces mirabilis]|uniref:hypothetical protein n=1 Tax=Streptomyces mirabilis TaxID=68239 RepID=UPI0033E8CC04